MGNATGGIFSCDVWRDRCRVDVDGFDINLSFTYVQAKGHDSMYRRHPGQERSDVPFEVGGVRLRL